MSDPNLVTHLFAEGLSADAASGHVSAGPSPAEGLRLFKAFTGIQDATLRRSVIHLVELLGTAAAKGSGSSA